MSVPDVLVIRSFPFQRVLLLGSYLIYSHLGKGQTYQEQHPYVTAFSGYMYPIPAGLVMNYSEERLKLHISDALFNDSVEFTLAYSDPSLEEEITFNFYVSGGIIDSCVFEGDQPLVFDFFVGYWPGVGDAGTIHKDGFAKIYFRSDMVMYREIDSLSAQIVITPISL